MRIYLAAMALSAASLCLARPDDGHELCLHGHGWQPADAKTVPAFDPKTGRDLWTYPPSPVVDAIHMRLDIDIPDMNAPRLAATQSLVVSPIGAPLQTLALDAHLLDVQAVSCAGHTVTFVYDGSRLALMFDPPIPSGEQRTIVTNYQVIDPPRGLTWTPESAAWPGRPAQIHSQGQAQTNSYWFPCHDFPNERVTTELVVTVPDGYLVSGNGREVEPVKRSGGRATYHWLQDKPHVNYLVSLVVGKFDVVDVAGRGARTPMPVYVPPGRGGDVAATYGRTPKMVEAFERVTGQAYPWDRYAQLVVWNFGAGGMENTAATTMYDTAILSPAALIDTDLDGLISHELAHQWFGDFITCNSWEHIWLNEGFATYFTNLWWEARDGADAYLVGVRGNFDSVVGRDRADAPFQKAMVSKAYTNAGQQFGGAASPYPKGAAILHMLRAKLGDEVFFRGIREYVARNGLKTVETIDFRRTLEQVSGESLERFFAQWCTRPGVPELKVTIDWDAAASELVVSATQLQNIDGYNPAFVVSLPIWASDTSGQGKVIGSIDLESKEGSARFRLAAEPAIVAVDPGMATLAKLTVSQPLSRWIAQAAGGPNAVARGQALRILADDATPEAVAAIVRIAREQGAPAWLRTQAVRSLAARKNAAEIIELARGTLPPDAMVELVESAALLAADPAVTEADRNVLRGIVISQASAGPSERVRAAAVRGLGTLKAVDSVSLVFVAAATESQHDRLRQAALDSLADLDAAEGLVVAMKYAAPGAFNRTRPEAIRAVTKLAHHDPDAAYAALAAALKDRETRAYEAAGAALVRLGDARASEVLRQALATRRDDAGRAQVQGWIDALDANLSGTTSNAAVAPAASGPIWVPIASPARWANTESDRELLSTSPEAFFARFGLITGAHDGRVYMLCSDSPEARLLPGEGAWRVSDVSVLEGEGGLVSIAFSLDDAGAERFGPLTERALGRPLAIIIGGEVYSAPTLRSRIERSAQVTGHFSKEDAAALAEAIKKSESLAIRIAAHISEVPDAQAWVKTLKERGPSIGPDLNK